MSKLSVSKKIPVEDFEKQRPWIEKLLTPLNTLIADLLSILNGGISLDDNMKSQSYNITLTSDGSRTSATFSWQWIKNQNPTMLVVAKLVEVGSTSVPATGFTWSISGKTVTCTISNLSASKNYELSVRGIV